MNLSGTSVCCLARLITVDKNVFASSLLRYKNVGHFRRSKTTSLHQKLQNLTASKFEAKENHPQKTSNNNDNNSFHNDSFHNDTQPPVLFIQKYKRSMDLSAITVPPPDKDDPDLKWTLPESQMEVLKAAISSSDTYESFVEKMTKNRKHRKPTLKFTPYEKPEVSKKPNQASEAAKSVFTDEEPLNLMKSNQMRLEDAAEEDLKWTQIEKPQLKDLPKYYAGLSKARLTLLVTITSAAGYGLAPGAFVLDSFILTTLGTALISCSANSINQILEVPYDSQMNRTKNRVLVRGNLTPLHAAGFAATTAVSGTLMLGCFVNPAAAALGVFNLVLYTCVYTPMKRLSIFNTWVGSVVGAVPPLIGWAGCSGGLDAGALILGGILFAWQFPHFNSLSWNLRPDYSKAGYRMMSVTNPDLCRRTALRYSAACIAVCTAAPILGVTDWIFPIDSLPLNGYLTYLAYNFYENPNSSTSRSLFKFSLLHLPFLMMLMFVSKKKKPEDEIVSSQKIPIS